MGRVSLVFLCFACGARSSDLGIDPARRDAGGDVDVDGDDDSDVDSQSDSSSDSDSATGFSDCLDLPSPWTKETPDPDSFGWVQLAIAPDGAPAILYTSRDGQWLFGERRAGAWSREPIGLPKNYFSWFWGPVFDSAGFAHVSMSDDDTVGYATNRSGAWVVEEISTAEFPFPRVVPTADGHAHVIYGDRAGFWHASNVGGSWTVEEIPGEGEAWSLAAAAGPRGSLHVAYVTPAWELRYGTDATGEWSFRSIEGSLGDDDFTISNMSTTPFLAFDGDSVFIDYHVPGELRVIRLEPDGSESRSAVSTALLEDRSLHWMFVPPDTQHVAYVSGFYEGGTELHYATTCAEGWGDVLVDTGGASVDPLVSPSVGVAPDGSLHIAFTGPVEFEPGYFGEQPKYLHP